MASTPVSLQATSGETVTVFLEATPDGSGTPNAGGYSATEKSVAKGWYGITITEALSGLFYWHAQDGASNILSNGLVRLEDDTSTYYCFDPGDNDVQDKVTVAKDQATIAAANTQR